MDYLSYPFLPDKTWLFLEICISGLVSCCFEDVIGYGVETPPWEDYFVTILRIFAYDSVYNSSLLVVNLKFLIILGPTAAIQHAPLYDLPHKSLLVSHFNSGPIFGAKAAVGLPNSFVGDVLVVVFGDYFPGTMRSRQEDP